MVSKEKIELIVRKHAKELINEKGYISPIDLLVKMGRVTPKQVEDWRMKKIPYLEPVTVGSPGKLIHTLHILKNLAKEQNLKASITVYSSWDK